MALPHKYCAWCGYRFGDTDFSCNNCNTDRGFFDNADEPAVSNPRNSSLSDIEERWHKVLWKEQVFDDNYVDKETFLNSLVTNANVRPFNYWAMAKGSVPVIRAISGVALFSLVFTLSWHRVISAQTLLVADTTIFCVAEVEALLELNGPGVDLRRPLVLIAALAMLTPILRELTAEWHDDSILAVSVTLMCAHLLTGQYSIQVNKKWHRVTNQGVTSLNLAILGSVILASRLHNNELVFAFLLFSVELFGLLPIWCNRLETDNQLKLTLGMSIGATISLFPVSKFVSLAHSIVVLCIAFVCPLWLMYVQRYKSLIQGQWDEAVPERLTTTRKRK